MYQNNSFILRALISTMLSSVKLLNVMEFGKVVENEFSFLFTTRTIMVQLVLTGYIYCSALFIVITVLEYSRYSWVSRKPRPRTTDLENANLENTDWSHGKQRSTCTKENTDVSKTL